jgi:steroid 5-alpha reductase family enzyme
MLALFVIWGTHSGSCLSLEFFGVLLFLFGSFINSFSDYQRFAWKMLPENHGHIYTKGLFRFSMHINFFGDSIMFVGFATITQNLMSFIPVLFIALNFILFQIPRLDCYLKNRYEAEFEEYASKTKKFIPFIY